MNELVFHNFSQTADLVGGDAVLVLTETSTLDEIVNGIQSNKIIWFYDGEKYRQVMAFKDETNGLVIYFFNDEGSTASYRFGDE